MTTRQIRRAAERKANNAAKAAYKAGLSSSQPDNHQDAEPIESEEELDTLIEEQRKDLQMARQLAQAKHEEAKQKAEQRQEAKQKAEREDEPKQKAEHPDPNPR
jgi:hypothetical protein